MISIHMIGWVLIMWSQLKVGVLGTFPACTWGNRLMDISLIFCVFLHRCYYVLHCAPQSFYCFQTFITVKHFDITSEHGQTASDVGCMIGEVLLIRGVKDCWMIIISLLWKLNLTRNSTKRAALTAKTCLSKVSPAVNQLICFSFLESFRWVYVTFFLLRASQTKFGLIPS